MKEWEATRDKWTEQLTRWKEVNIESLDELLIRSDQTFRNAQDYKKTASCVLSIQLPFPSAFDPMHSCTLVCGGTLTATEVFCDKGYTRDIQLMLLLPVTQLLSINILKLSVKLNLNSKPNCFKSASMVTIYLEFELMEWQGHTIRCSAFVNNKYQWSQDEGWGDWEAKEGSNGSASYNSKQAFCSGVNLKPLCVETQDDFCWDTEILTE